MNLRDVEGHVRSPGDVKDHPLDCEYREYEPKQSHKMQEALPNEPDNDSTPW